MSVYQPTLWHNAALESGYNYLNDLKLDEAMQQFNEALQSPKGEEKNIHRAIVACQYWQPRIQQHSQTDAGASVLLADFIPYSFTPRMKGLKKTLLRFIVDQLCNESAFNLNEVETAFDQLIFLGIFQKAEDLILFAIEQYPDRFELLYFLAQAQWLKGIQAEANGNYLRALLYYPDTIYFSRIENKRLKALTEIHTPEMIPAFAWVEGVLGFITLKEKINPLNKLHEKGIKCYSLLQKAEETLRNNDIKSSTRYRAKLQKIDTALFQKYFDLLQQKKGIFNIADHS